MKPRHSPAAVPELLRRVITGLDLESGLRPFRVMQAWEEVVGPLLAPHTRAVDCRLGVVYAEARSAAFMNELVLSKPKILERLRDRIPGLVANDLRARLGGGFPGLSREVLRSEPSAEAIRAAEASLGDVQDPEVRAFLSRAMAAQAEFLPSSGDPTKR